MSSILRTAIVDSDADLRLATRRLLLAMPGIAVVAEFDDVAAILRMTPAPSVDAVIIEVKDDTAAPVSRLAQAFPDLAILATGPVTSADLVIQTIRAGALEYLRRPIDREELTAAVTKLLRVRRADTKAPGRVTSVFSTKGGLGVTTLAVNLGVAIAERETRKTILVELDTRPSDVATFLDLHPKYSVLDAIENVGRLDESFLQGLLTRHPSGLAVLPAPARLYRNAMSAEHVQACLEIIRSHFDEVILDLRHELDPPTVAALEASDMVLFVTEPNVAALRSTANGFAAFRHLGLDSRRVKPVLMRDGTGEDVTLKHAKEALEIPIFWRIPSDYQTVVASINHGRPVVTSAARSRVATSLRQLSQTLVSDSSATAKDARRGASLLRFAFNPRST